MDETLHIACPHCAALNRVPRSRLGQSPNCGKCKQPLFTGTPVTLDESTFDRHVGADLPVVVDFWADWCGPCKMMAPHFERAARSVEPTVRFAKLDTEAAPAIAGRYGIRSIPTVIAFRNGREIARQSGAMDQGTLERWVHATLNGR